MAGYKSTYLSNRDLDYNLGNGTPATFYLALYTTLPDANGVGGVEVSGGSYARLSITNNTTNFPAAAAASKSNGATWTFAAPTAAWGNVVGAALLDASSGGNLYYIGPFSVPKNIHSGDPALSLPAGAAVFTES
jgi:hypothetical protein